MDERENIADDIHAVFEADEQLIADLRAEIERLREALRQMTGAPAQLEPRAAKIARAALGDTEHE